MTDTAETTDHWELYTTEVQAIMGVFALQLQLEQRLNCDPSEGGLGRPECHLLIILAVPRRMGELARLAMKTPSAVTAAAAELERQGLISRVRDPRDGRAWLLELTESGQAHRQELISAACEIFYETSGLTEDEAKVLAGLARKIHNKAIQSGVVRLGDGDQ